MQQARDAQNFINLKGRHEIRAILRNFIDDLTLLLDQYSSHVEQRVGFCVKFISSIIFDRFQIHSNPTNS